jgi:hypothetical protein
MIAHTLAENRRWREKKNKGGGKQTIEEIKTTVYV